jgi:DHA3 family macrolide efflux protein-like MFS transporter
MIQQSYPPKELGRILGVLNSLLSLTGPLGLIFAGPLADAIGVEQLFIIAGISAAISGIVAWLIPVVKNYDRNLQSRLALQKVPKREQNSN